MYSAGPSDAPGIIPWPGTVGPDAQSEFNPRSFEVQHEEYGSSTYVRQDSGHGSTAIFSNMSQDPSEQFYSMQGFINIPPGGDGQRAPANFNTRVTTVSWEEETTLCIVVETGNTSITRRVDNNMINGTKLLNVAGMTRGRRDGILKGEKVRHVVKIGSMHLKGVWIPFERALDIAKREGFLDILYPLFLADIEGFLYHPSNLTRTIQVVRAAERNNPLFHEWEEGIPNKRRPPLQSSPQTQVFQERSTQYPGQSYQQQPPYPSRGMHRSQSSYGQQIQPYTTGGSRPGRLAVQSQSNPYSYPPRRVASSMPADTGHKYGSERSSSYDDRKRHQRQLSQHSYQATYGQLPYATRQEQQSAEQPSGYEQSQSYERGKDIHSSSTEGRESSQTPYQG